LKRLSEMPNIGEVLEKKLIDVEIPTPEALKQIGSKEAFTRIKIIDNTACLNMLCALEGAVQDIRWHNLPEACKEELKKFFKTF
jgi:DNA transformation protein